MLLHVGGGLVGQHDAAERRGDRLLIGFAAETENLEKEARRKLETKRPFIKTIRGVGYQFLKSPQDEAAE